MSVKRVEVETYKEYLICDDCNENMIWNNYELTSNPPQYDHQCPKCGKVERTRGNVYPKLFCVDKE